RLVLTPQQHLLRLHITVDSMIRVSIVSGLGNLLNVGKDGRQWHSGFAWMKLSERTVGGILHHQKRRLVIEPKVEDSNNMRVLQTCQGLCLAAEILCFIF